MNAETTDRLDPRTASVGFYWSDLTGEDDYGERIFYWFDPNGKLPAVNNWELRKQHPEIDPQDWNLLFYAAGQRGETSGHR